MGKFLKKFEESKEHVKRKCFFKKLIVQISIGRKLNSIDRKAVSIEPGKFKPKLLSHFRLVKQQL